MCGAIAVVLGCLRDPHRADKQICVYPEYQSHAKDNLDISDMLKPYEEASDCCSQSSITEAGHFIYKYTIKSTQLRVE